MIQISVIVPFYNAAKYLNRCIESILLQTVSDFELILVDDGSKDNSFEICFEYLKQDKRIRLFQKENGGVSSARNLGIEKSRGKWICFVDSDDYVSPSYLHNLLSISDSQIENHLIGNRFVFKGTNYPEIYGSFAKDQILIFINQSLSMSPMCKLFKKNILLDYKISFPVGVSKGEDFCFVCDYLNYVSGITIGESSDYFYEYSDISITTKRLPFKEDIQNYQAMRQHFVTLLNTIGEKNVVDAIWRSGVNDRFRYAVQSIYHENVRSFWFQYRCLSTIRNDLSEYASYINKDGKIGKLSYFFMKYKMVFALATLQHYLIPRGKIIRF